jgi:hypothetical protein
MPNRIDSMISHGMGKVKAVKARLHGLVGVFRTLSEQHGEVVALMERARATDEKFTELWPTIRQELRSHERAELREVFSELRAYDATRAMADHHDQEADELELLLAQIDEQPIGSATRKELFAELIDTVKHHAKEEEEHIFRRAQNVLGKARAESLDRQFLVAKKQLAELV